MSSSKKCRQSGFSLLEILVAFSIMAMSLAVLYRSMGSSSRQMGALAWEQQAALLAETLLESRDEIPLEGWHERGQDHLFLWEIQSAPYKAAKVVPISPSSAAAPASVHLSGVEVALHEVDVTIRWGTSQPPRQLSVKTLRPVRVPPGKLL